MVPGQSWFLNLIDWWCGLFGFTNATGIVIVDALAITGVLYLAVTLVLTLVTAVIGAMK